MWSAVRTASPCDWHTVDNPEQVSVSLAEGSSLQIMLMVLRRK